MYSWFIWQCISCFRWHEKPGKSNVKWKHFFLDFGPTLDEEWLVENYIYHSYSCFDSSALWTLHFTMYYEFCNPKVGGVLPDLHSESQRAIYPYEWCSYYELRATRVGNEGGNRQNRLHIERRTLSWAGLWTLSYMPSIYGNNIPTGKPGPQKEEPQGLYLDSPSPKKYPNYLCNQIESYSLLCLLGYDHRLIDNCPLLTT